MRYVLKGLVNVIRVLGLLLAIGGMGAFLVPFFLSELNWETQEDVAQVLMWYAGGAVSVIVGTGLLRLST